MKLNILVVGLPLQANKGGPALALSMIEILSKHISADYCFAVPYQEILREQQWAERYNVSAVPYLVPRNWVPLMGYRKVDRFRHALLLTALRESDMVINSSGIAFAWRKTQSLGKKMRLLFNTWNGHMWFRIVKKHDKPLLRWTQSYGPFSHWFISLIARLEFKDLPFIMARGRISRKRVEKLGVKCPVYDFPDVAFVLPPSKNQWAENYLYEKLKVPKECNLFGLSPSAVIRSYPDRKDSSLGTAHVSLGVRMMEKMVDNAWHGILIPHTIKVDGPPNKCDLDVARQIWSSLPPAMKKKVTVIQDDLDCRELKAIIGKMNFFVGARYHSLVAALSMGVPATALAWHEKYTEMIDYFGMREVVIDSRIINNAEAVKRIYELFIKREELKQRIKEHLPSVTKAVEESGRLFAEAIKEKTSEGI